MIDRNARNKLAEEVRHFMGCFKTNFEYDDAAFDINTKDRGVIEIRQNIWLTYDDLRKHKMEGDWALTEDQMKIVKRCIVFLKSDFEYTWPKWPFYYRIVRPIIWLLSFGRLIIKSDKYFNGGGDLNVWPFISNAEYMSAKQEPKYCANNT